MTDENLIPAAVGRAATRGFIRTTAQAYATSIPTTLSVGFIGDAFENPTKTIITILIGVLTPVLAGSASFFSIIGNGVPADYQVDAPIEVDDVEAFNEANGLSNSNDDIVGDI